MYFSRSNLLLGDEAMQRLATARVIIFGTGGVGSWCAESLIRTGLRHLTLVDFDTVSPSNVNRQAMATARTIGKVKVDAMRTHLLEINPDADITAVNSIYNADTADSFHLDNYDYVIDAIDSLRDKVLLIQRATASRACLFSAMGAALKSDPTRLQVAEFWKVRGCPLAAALRRTFKRMGCKPAKKFLCVFSEELLKNKGADKNGDNNTQPCGETTEAASPINKPHTNGSLVQVTAPAGFTLASLVINNICQTEQ